jgi:hypothetical protein
MQCRGADTGPSPGKVAFSSCDPASAQRHFAPQRVRDDTLHARDETLHGVLSPALATRATRHAIPPAHRRSLRDAPPTGLTNGATLDTMAVIRSATI